MRLSVQTDNPCSLKEALSSSCSAVRFGSEYCEFLLPSLSELQRAYELTCKAGKQFTYVTPRLSNAGVNKLKEQLSFLDGNGKVRVVINDFGALNVLKRHTTLVAHLGRHLVRVPARSPWTDRYIEGQDPSSDKGRWVRQLYSTTSLNHRATKAFYQHLGCRGVDLDWIPHVLPALRDLVGNGFCVSVYLFLVPATFTRKCHTARFLGEKSPEECSRPCATKAFLLRNEVFGALGQDLYLHGNVVFRVMRPSVEDIGILRRCGVEELVLPMGPLTGIDTADKIDRQVLALGLENTTE